MDISDSNLQKKGCIIYQSSETKKTAIRKKDFFLIKRERLLFYCFAIFVKKSFFTDSVAKT
jgi:hypothetical protein